MPVPARALGAAGAALLLLVAGCGEGAGESGARVVFPGSAVGAEAELLEAQIERFERAHPGIRVVRRATPDDADARHQLYVQKLAARVPDPDVLQLDVVWTAEFAAAGWIRPLAPLGAEAEDLFAAALRAARFRGRLYALPWFVDVGLLYWRTDLLEAPPARLDRLAEALAGARGAPGVRYGLVLPAARYEGLVAVFLEVLGGFGGRILDGAGRVVVDSEAAVRALRALRGAVEEGVVPEAALGWREEETRFAFQRGRAVLMRNWPYAVPLLADPERSAVAGRFAVAPMPAAPGGRPTAALGGSLLAVSAWSDAPEAAFSLVEFLTRPEAMLERAERVGQYPPRPSLYAPRPEGGPPPLAGRLPVEPADARRAIEGARARPRTPLYAELSGLLQVRLHEALTGQRAPRAALEDAAREMRALLARKGLSPSEEEGGGGAG